jgi:hypothetical protein
MTHTHRYFKVFESKNNWHLIKRDFFTIINIIVLFKFSYTAQINNNSLYIFKWKK